MGWNEFISNQYEQTTTNYFKLTVNVNYLNLKSSFCDLNIFLDLVK